jgi:hypothetical protein
VTHVATTTPTRRPHTTVARYPTLLASLWDWGVSLPQDSDPLALILGTSTGMADKFRVLSVAAAAAPMATTIRCGGHHDCGT